MIVIAQITLSINVREVWWGRNGCSGSDSEVQNFLECIAQGLPVALMHRPDVADARHLHTTTSPLTGTVSDDFQTQHSDEQEFAAVDLSYTRKGELRPARPVQADALDEPLEADDGANQT